MSDEDLLIGGKQEAPALPNGSGSTGIQVPMDIVNASVFGVFKTLGNSKNVDESGAEEYVEQKFAIQIPRHEPAESVAQFIWTAKFLPQAALRAVGSGGEVNFYPLDMFKRFVIRVSPVVGVTL